MLKFTIEVKENKNKDSCNVKLINPKDLSKASENEKNCAAMVLNQINKTFIEMNKSEN